MPRGCIAKNIMLHGWRSSTGREITAWDDYFVPCLCINAIDFMKFLFYADFNTYAMLCT